MAGESGERRGEAAGKGVKENDRKAAQTACNWPDTTKPATGRIWDGLVQGKIKWWRRRESNPGPEKTSRRLLHA